VDLSTGSRKKEAHILTKPVTIKIAKELDISHAGITGLKIAESMGFNRVQCCAVRTSISELANNLLFHTVRGGTLTISIIDHENKKGIEITADDDGPGIPDIKLAMQDGYSTSGGLGGGLSGVSRLMDEFEIKSKAGAGTCIKARKWNKK